MKKTKTQDQHIRKADAESFTIPVVQEFVNIGKQEIESGSVRFRKVVEEENVNVRAEVSKEEIEVKRIRINQPVDVAPPGIRYEGDTMIVSIMKEEVVIQKRLILLEELHITKHRETGEVQQPVTLKKEKVFVERKQNSEGDDLIK